MDLIREKQRARVIFEKTYNDLATIKVYEKDIVNGITKTVLKTIYENIPCNLSFKYKYNTVEQRRDITNDISRYNSSIK